MKNIKDQIKIILNHFTIGDYKYVLIKAKELSKKNPNNSYLKNLLGSTYLKINDINNAIKNFELSIQLDPSNNAAMNNLGNAYKNSNDYKNSEKFYLRALELNPNYVNTLLNYSNLKININQVYESIDLLNKAISIEPKNYIIHFSLATAYQAIGKFDEVKDHANKTLKINPYFSPADKLLSSYLKYNEDHKHFVKMKKDIFNDKISKANKVYLHFAIAKAYEDIGNLNKTIEHLEKGNNAKRSLINYDFNKDINLINKIKLIFKDIDFKKINLQNIDKKIIFVLGMPRAGTSLLEQILSSHSKVFGAGELPFMRNIILKNFIENQDNPQNILNEFSNLNKLAQSYIDKTSILRNGDRLILDKAPLNFLWIGFIKILFPNAKIIHINRNSKDTCFSCYKNLFSNGLNFTYQKKELASFYNAYSDLMKFWNLKLGDFIYTVNYENLVDDLEKNTKEILKFCELDFENACSKFYENKSPIKTMSAAQARQKIYKTSVMSYKKYEDKLSDLFDNLIQ